MSNYSRRVREGIVTDSPNLLLEGQGLGTMTPQADASMRSMAGGGAATTRPMAAGGARGGGAAAMRSGQISPTRPFSPTQEQEGDSIAHEVESELKHQGDLAKQNRDRVEAMRAQLRKFQQLTTANAKEIKTLRAAKFKRMQTENELLNASLEEGMMDAEDAARQEFASKTFVVPHSDLPDVGAAKGGVDKETADKTADAENRIKDELYPASDPDSDVESICGGRGMLELAALVAREEAGFMKVKTYKGSLFGPKGVEQMEFERESHLQPILQTVCGYSVRGRHSNALWLASRKAVYTSGAIAIVSTPDAAPLSVQQDFFTMHSEEISAICVHPNGLSVATGEQADNPTIYVWDSSSMELLCAPLTGFHTRGIACLEFSKDGMLLFVVGSDTAHTISVYDWKTGALICHERADVRLRVIAMRCNPHDGVLVTVGVRHIKFWSLTVAMGTETLAAAPPISVWQKKLEPKRGVFGRHGISKSHTLLCVEFGGPGVTITGTRDGNLLVWKGVVLASWLQAHVGPVLSLFSIPALGQTKLCSGGKDGSVGIWMFDSSLHLLYKPVVLPKEHKACIRSVCWHETMGEVLVATSAGKILMLSPDPERARDPPKLLTRAHQGGPVRALAGHPDGTTFVTGGADGKLLLWDVENGSVLSECTMPFGITYAAYHKDGNKIAVCMDQCGGYLVSQTPKRTLAITSYRFCELVKTDMTLAKYSPEADMIICAWRSKLEIYNADALKSRIGALVGHEGIVKHVDWSTDGRYLVSTSDTYELIFWDRFTGKPVLASSVADFADPQNAVTWASWTCNLGWAVQGVAGSGPDEFFITSVCRDAASNIMLTGDASGGVSLFPYPCPGSCYPVSPPRLHVGPVAQAIFLLNCRDDPSPGAKEGGRIVTLGSVDATILIWNLQKAAPRVETMEEKDQDKDTGKLAQEVELIIQESRANLPVVDDMVVGGVTDEFESVKPYLMSVCPPSEPVNPPEEFNWRIGLQYIHGFQGSYGRASAFVAETGEIVYAAAACCILQMPDNLNTQESAQMSSQIQRHFTQHTDHIHCMACHPKGLVVASSDGQANSEILVWNVGTLEVKARLPTKLNNVALMCYSSDGSVLVVVSNEISSHCSVSVWDWQNQELLAIEDGERIETNRILSVAAEPLATATKFTFMTCGVNHVKFWSVKKSERGYSLNSQRGDMSNDDATNVMLCVCGGVEGSYITGTDTGELFLWRQRKVAHIVPAHDGPVFCLACREIESLCSASSDTCIKIWDFSLRPLHTIQLREHLGNTFLDLDFRATNPTIITLDWNSKLNRILVGTGGGDLIDLKYNKKSVELLQLHAHGHSRGRILALCSHPSQMLVASAGEDMTIRIWELSETPTLFCMFTSRSIITAMAFSPGDGNMLAYGQDNGSIHILDVTSIGEFKVKKPMACDDLMHSTQPPRKRKVSVEVLRFSPNGKYLVSGCASFIDVFSADDAFQFVGVCKGHSGTISQLDFDSEGNHLQSNTWSDELKYWDIPACVETRRATNICDSQWASFTCRLAWHVLAVIPTGNEGSLRSISCQNGKERTVFAAGFADGSLKLMPFPAPEPEFRGFTSSSNSRSINHLCYSHNDAYLIVAGGPDPVLQVYNHYQIQDIPSDDSEIRAIVNSRRPKAWASAHVSNEEAQMNAVKPYLGALFAPTTEPFICPVSALPNYRMSLEFVQSFRGHDTRHSLFYTASGGLAFIACGMIIIQEGNDTGEIPRQRHFCEHKGDVTSLALHANGTLVASSESGPAPVILVWDVQEFDESKNKFRIRVTLSGSLVEGKMLADSKGISHLCFGGPDGMYLFALGLSEGHPISMYDWKAPALLKTVFTKVGRILSMKCNPIDHSVVTCGVKHLRFWTVRGGDSPSMLGENAFFGDRILPRTMCCVDFVVLGAYSRTLTGSIDGCIFLWKNAGELLSIIKEAHVQSIFDFAFDKANFLFFSAGRDGVLRTWTVDDHDGSLTPKGQSAPMQSLCCDRCGFFTSAPPPGGIRLCPNCAKKDLVEVPGGVACIRSLSMRGQHVVIGTSGGELVLVVPDSFAVTEAAAAMPKEMRMLVPSHGKGAVSTIEFHPSVPSIFFTVGDDCILRMWDIEERKLVLCIRLADAAKNAEGAMEQSVVATALHVSRDGKFVGVGFSNGHLTLLDCIISEKKLTKLTQSDANEFSVLRRGVGVSCLKFSANGRNILLAAGTCDGVIYVFQDDEGRDFLFACTCKGHSGKILTMDWSLDGTLMQSTSEECELLFWKIDYYKMDPKEILDNVSFMERERLERPRLRCKLQRPIMFRDVEWAEWTNSLGWWVQGARKIASDETFVLSTHAPVNSSLCVLGDVHGQISLMPFPCSEKSPLLYQASVRTGAITCVRLSPGEHDYVLASSQHEGGLFLWRVEAKGKSDLAAMGQTGSSNDTCWQRVMERLTTVHASQDLANNQVLTPSNTDDSFLASVHPYLSAIRQPVGWRPSAEAVKAPDNELKLEYVFGYRGHDCTRNLFKIKNQELLYYVASVCVILNPHNQRRTQRIFDKHLSDIECIAVSPDGTTVASVSSGLRPKALVWNSKSMKVIGHVDSVYEGKLCAMCFSGDGKVLALAVTNGETTSVAFYSWSNQILLAEHKAQPWTILAFESNPLTGTFVTAGVRHVAFWRLSGRNLSIQMGLVEQSQTLTSISFLGANERENTIVVANSTGHLLMWKEDKDTFGNMPPDKIIPAHSGPVFDTTTDDSKVLITCSKGGEVRIWKHEARCQISCELSLVIALPEESSNCNLCGKTGAKSSPACLRTIARIKKMDMASSYSLIVGTGNNCLYEAFIDASETTLEAGVLMPSHAEGKIVGLAPHPGKAFFATCGEDRSLKVWDREERMLKRERHLPHDPTSLSYSVDGSRLVVGFITGEVEILNSVTLEVMGTVDVVPKRKVRDLKFSPDGRLLAVASEDSKIYVYAVPLTRQFVAAESAHAAEERDDFKLAGLCKGHAHGVVRLDWSSDGTRMQSESEAYDTILWDMSVSNKQRFDPISNAQAHADIHWHSRDCLLTWHTSGLLHPVADYTTMLTSTRSKLGDTLAVGDYKGGVRLYRFPCCSKDSRFRFYHGHSEGVSKICFSYEDRHVISAGFRDQAVFVWHHLIIPGPEETDAIIDEMIRSKKHHHAAAALTKISQVELENVPSYLSAVVTPTSWNAEEARLGEPADVEMTMEYVYGFRGTGRNQCIRCLDDKEIIYLAAMVIVIMDLHTRSQRFFRTHEHDIMCFALHPGGTMVASADCGQSGKVLVWNKHTMEVVSSVATLAKQSASAIIFSEDAALLFCVMDNHENTIVAVEWESNKKAAIEKSGNNQVLAIGTHPNGQVLVTCGYKHIKFWTVEKGHMYPTSGSFGVGKPQTMICIEFTEEDEGVQPLTLTGAQNGCIYMWREHLLERIIVAHSSPILDMCMTRDGALTCGIDGLVRLWSFDWTSCARLDVAELTRGLQGFCSGVMTPIQSVILLRDDAEESEMRRIVVGLDSNEIYLLIFDGHPEDVDVLPETQILVQGHAAGGLSQVCPHPSRQEFATIGLDRTLRTWDCDRLSPISFVRLPEKGTALAYFPDGKSVAAGLSNGKVLKIDAESAEITDIILEKRTKKVTRIKFSPSGKLLAIGYESGIIDVLDVGAIFVLLFSCKAMGSVEQVDFSSDEAVLQVSTSALELTFWNVGAHGGKQIIRPVEFRDKSWATWTSRFGFAVQALSPTIRDVTSIQKARGNVLVAALTNGRFTAYRYPAIGEDLPFKSYHGHLAPLGDICFTADDQRLISVGTSDCSIVQWKVSMAEEEVSSSIVGSDVPSSIKKDAVVSSRIVYFFLDYVFDEWEAKIEDAFIAGLAKLDSHLSADAIQVLEVLPGSVILKVQITAPKIKKILEKIEEDHRNPVGQLRRDLRVSHLITDEDIFWLAYRPKSNSTYLSKVPKIEIIPDLSQDPDLLKPYISTRVQPNVKIDKNLLKAPVEYLELEHVYGFAGFNRIGNLHYVQTGEVLYTVANVAVLHDSSSGKQSYFRKHFDEIVAVTLHKDGQLVATADNGPTSIIFVWSSVTMEALMRLSPTAGAAVVAMCFSGDKSKLVVVNEIKDSAIEIFDWRKKKLHVSQQIDRNKVLSIRSNPFDEKDTMTFVTCGVNHIRGWALKGDILKGHSWTGDVKGKGVLQTIPTICFPSRSCVIGATQGGSLYIFKFLSGSLMLAKTIDKVHKGAIFELWCNESTVLSGGKDGVLNRWRFSVKLGSVDLQYLKSSNIRDQIGCADPVSVKSISFRESPPTVAIGTANNQVYEINEISNETHLVVMGHSGGHSAKALNQCLSPHPKDPNLMLSGGADGNLVLFDLKDKKSLEQRMMDAPIAALQYSNSGNSFAVGLASGHLFVHNAPGIKADMLGPEKQRTNATHSLKFAPNDQFLAVGVDPMWIDVYDVAGRQCNLIATLKGHTGPVKEIDWERGSEMIRTVSSTLELLYWDVPAKVQILRVNELEKAEWHTHHCKLGWYAGGVLQASGNEHTINSIDVCEYSKDKKLMIVSGSDGEVKMFHFPVLDAQASARVTVGHAPLVTKTRFSSDAQRVLTLGGKDQSIMQWRILVTTLHPLVKLLASKADPEFPLYEVPGNNLMKAMMVQRASRMVQHTEPPTSHLELDFVHGYGGHNNNANLFVVESGELIYNAGALVVVYDSLARSQFFFREHQNDIMAMALHPDGYHVASADAGISPAICVWHVEAMVCLARLDGGGLPGVGGFESGVPALAFSPDGTRIAAVGADKEHTLYLLDWRAKKTIAAGKCGGGRVLACAFLPYEKDMLVTVGVRHVKFWTNAGTKMIGRDGVFGKHVLKCTMQCVDVNPANFVGHAGQKSVTLTGGMDGRLYAFGTIMSDGEWRPEALNSSIIAHVGPVFDIRHDHITLLIVSCGSDGYIKTWKLKTSLNPKDKSKTELDLTVHETFLVSQIVTDLPVHVSEATFGKSVLFSKKKTGPVLLIGTNTDEIFECGINTEFKIVKDPKTHLLLPANLLIAGQGGSMTDLVIHPTRPLSFSVGTDSVVKMWDTEHNCLVAAKGFEVPVVTVDFLEDGNRLVVGASDGTIILLTSFWDIGEDGKGPGKWVFEELARTDAKGQVTIIRFSGDVLGERFIAAGRSDGLIDFFSAKGNDLDYVESTRASDGERHQGPIISLDWSINPQGYVQSTCDRGGLFYYGPLPAPRRETNQEIIAGLEMGSWNSKVGWPVKSLQECFDSTQHVTAASTSHSNQLIAVGDISGSISVCHFPCIDPLPGNKFGGHSHSPIAVKFQNHDKQILSAGRSDNCLIQWRHFLTPPSYDWEVSSLLDSVRLHVMSEDKVTAGDTGASMLAPLRWKPTRKVFEMATLAPSFVLELEHVYGYRGHDMKGNILFLHRKNVSPEILWSGEILYHIAGVAVIHQIYTNQQRLVQLGMKSIISQALSEDALRVVTGEAGDDPAVVVWRSSDGLIMNRFEGFHKNGVVAVCFSISESGSRIMTIGCDEFHKIAIYELSDTTATPGEKMPLAWRTGGPSDILAVGCHQVNGTDIYVTVGARHVRSWTVEKLETETKTTFELNYTKASFGQYDKYVTFTCVTFAEGLVVIGTDNGSIYFMQHNCIVKVIECAHASSGTIGVPVLDLDFVVDSSQIVSAGADGKVTFWNLNAKGEQVEVTRKEGAYDIGEISRRAKNLNQVEGSIHAFSPVPDVEIPLRVKSAKCLMTKGRDSSADEMQVLMGTRSNEIILRGSVSKKQTILMQGHLGGTVTAVAAHPSKLLFASGGSDKSLKIWDAENKMMIAMGFAEAEIMCTAWALKASASHHIATGLVGGGIAVFQYTVGRHQLTTSAIKIENHHRREGFACIKYSPDSMQIALGSVCGHLDVFDVIQGYVWTGSAHVSHKTVMSVDWSFDCRLIQACTQERKISYWDVSRKDVKTFARKSKDVTRDQVWGSWTSPIGWAVNGISWETSQVGLVKQVDVLANMKGTFDIELVKGDLDVPSLALTSTANGIHLFNFPVLPDAKAWSVTHPSTQNAATCFARDGSRVYSVGGDGICVLQWRLLSPNEVGLSGQLTRAKRAAEKTFTLLDREKFWKITRKEIDELTRRGVRSDIIRIVEPQSRELQEARLNVVDFTFEQVDMALVGRNVGGQPMILPLEANVTWNELLMLFEQFVLEKDDDGLPKMWSFMYEKFNINTKEGWTEVSEMRLRYLNPSLREAEIIKLKNESRVSFSVKTELDFRQCWHWIEHEYRWVLSFAADVPEGQRFPLSVYLIPYIKKVKKKDDGLDTGETSDAESDVDLILYARRGISKKKDGVVEEKKDEDKKKLEFAAPTGWDELGPTDVEKLDAKPQYRITFDSMHGYNGRKCRGNIGVLKEGEIVYPVGSSVVVHDRAQNKQKIFSSHEDTVMCLAVGPDRETVATATIGEDPEVLIWNGYSLALKQRFRKDHESCVVALSFSYKDNWIASVGGDDSKEMTIAVYDYVQGTTVIKEDRAGKSRIISIAFNPNVRAGEMHFVTVGVRHVRFWSLQRGKLVGRKGTYDIGRGSESMIAVAFTDPNHASAHKDVTFTGSKDGRIFIWRDAKAIYTVQSFKGPIFDLIVHGGTVVSGGKDSMAPIREWKIGRGWPTRLELTPAKGSDDQGLSVAQKAEGSGAAGRSSGGCVRALGWNGSELIVGTSSNAIHTLNPRNGVSQLLLQAHWKGAITAVAAHPSKPLVVSVGDDGAVRILNWKDKSFIQYRSLNEPATAVTVSMAYPNAFIAGMTETNGTKGEHIAVGLQSGELRILSMSLEDVNGLVRDYGTVRCQEHSTSRQGVEIWVLRYSPDGEWLALGAGDATLDLYKVSAGYLHVQSCDGHGGPVTGIDWSAQKTARGVQYIHSCSTVGRTVMNWSMTPAQDGDVKVEAINQIAVRDEPWHTWSLPLGWPVQAITGGALSSDSCATCVARSGLTGKLSSIVAVGDTSGDLSVFQFPCVSARTSAVNSVIRHFGGISALTFTSDESRLITAGQTDQMIMVSLLKPFATLSDTQEACEAGAVISPMALVRNLCSFVSVSNNLKMVAAVLSDLDVLIWEVGGLKDGAWNCSVKARLAGHSQSVNTCRFSPDDRFVASAARDKSLRLWNVDGSSAASFSGHQRDVITCSYAPNGKLVAGGDSNKTLLVWDGTGLASEALRAKAEGHRKSILCVSWSDDSRRLCTGSEDKTLRIWSVPDSVYKAGEPTTDLSVEVRLRGHTEAVVSCAFSAHESTSDKMRVCSGSMDKTVIVWHVGTGTDLCRILFDDCLLGCAFSMCSGFVGAVCLDNSVHVWDVTVDGEPELVDKYISTLSAAVNVVGCAFTADGTLPILMARPPDRLVHAATLYLPNPRVPQ